MNFVEFADNRFQELTVGIVPGKFSVKIDAECEALKKLMWVFRFVVSLVLIPKVIVHYAAVLCHVAKPPVPAMANLQKVMAEQKAAEEIEATEKRLAKIGRKVGFNTVKGAQNDVSQ